MVILVITGERGVGKTTLLRKIVEESERDFYGVVSERFDKGYYVKDIKTKEKKILCSEEDIGFKFRKFYFDPAALQFVEECLKRKGDILVYDEIGYLEAEGKTKIWEYIKEPAILIVRKELTPVISSRFNGEVLEVTRENREQIKEYVLKKMEKALKQ